MMLAAAGGTGSPVPARVEEIFCAGLILPRYVGEFWTSAQRAGHPLHEVPYRACFKPELPRFFITRLTEPGDLVHDPFMAGGPPSWRQGSLADVQPATT